MNRSLLALTLLAAAGVAADAPLPKAETILDRYVQVTGGKNAYLKRKTEIATGTVEFIGKGVKGSVNTYSAEPNRTYIVMDVEGVGKIESGTINGVAWEQSAVMGPRIKDGEERADQINEASFNAPARWREIYSKVETQGIETVEGEECYKVLQTPKKGRSETGYYSRKSGLLIKRSKLAVSPMGEIPVEVVFANYKSFGGVMEPSRMTQRMAGQEFQITVEKVKFNAEIPADRFQPPAEVRALIQK